MSDFKAGMYWIVYNQWDDCVEYCEGEPHWYNGNKCWCGSGKCGMISFRSCHHNHKGEPMRVYLTKDDVV